MRTDRLNRQQLEELLEDLAEWLHQNESAPQKEWLTGFQQRAAWVLAAAADADKEFVTAQIDSLSSVFNQA